MRKLLYVALLLLCGSAFAGELACPIELEDLVKYSGGYNSVGPESLVRMYHYRLAIDYMNPNADVQIKILYLDFVGRLVLQALEQRYLENRAADVWSAYFKWSYQTIDEFETAHEYLDFITARDVFETLLILALGVNQDAKMQYTRQ